MIIYFLCHYFLPKIFLIMSKFYHFYSNSKAIMKIVFPRSRKRIEQCEHIVSHSWYVLSRPGAVRVQVIWTFCVFSYLFFQANKSDHKSYNRALHVNSNQHVCVYISNSMTPGSSCGLVPKRNEGWYLSRAFL